MGANGSPPLIVVIYPSSTGKDGKTDGSLLSFRGCSTMGRVLLFEGTVSGTAFLSVSFSRIGFS